MIQKTVFYYFHIEGTPYPKEKDCKNWQYSALYKSESDMLICKQSVGGGNLAFFGLLARHHLNQESDKFDYPHAVVKSWMRSSAVHT